MGDPNAPGYFHNLIGDLFGDIPGFTHYIDDVTIASDTMDEHYASVRLFLERCETYNFVLKPSKAFIAYDEVTALGALVDMFGFKPHHGLCTKVRE